jgi:hypothetical protein
MDLFFIIGKLNYTKGSASASYFINQNDKRLNIVR